MNLYGDSYYETLINGTFQAALSTPIRSYGSTTTFIRGCLVLLLRAGFVLVQLGSVPIENVYIILLQNIVDIAVSIASFVLVGYILAFGFDILDGTIGHGMWIISESADLDNAIFGLSACIIATAIVTTILSGRIHFIGYLLTCLLFSMFFQPVVMHWVWHDVGWLHRRKFMGHLVSVKDHAGGLVIHVTAGVVGLIGAVFLGRRLIKLSDIDESSIGAESPGSTITGYIFIALGLIGFSLPAPSYELTHIPNNYIALILVNNIMAMAAGIIVVVVLQFLFFREPFNYWIILRCLQGTIAGIVSIASGIDVYTPVIAYAIASFSALIFYFAVLCVHTSSLEDYCNIIAIHLVCGLLGTMLPPILGSTENLGSSIVSHLRVIHLGWQLVGIATISGLMIVVFTIHFSIMSFTGLLRNRSEELNHRRGVTAAFRGPERCFLQRLFTLYPNTPYIEPGTIGKSPEQFRAYRNVDFVGSGPEIETKYKKPTVLKEEVKVEEIEKKPRFIYTVHKIDDRFRRTLDSFQSSGDACSSNMKQDIEKSHNAVKLEELINAVENRFSHRELHRTKKVTNLFRRKPVGKKWGLRALRQASIPQTYECASYDSKYNDGFVTIKMPVNDYEAHLSDASDS